MDKTNRSYNTKSFRSENKDNFNYIFRCIKEKELECETIVREEIKGKLERIERVKKIRRVSISFNEEKEVKE